jgi:hypothetical protein
VVGLVQDPLGGSGGFDKRTRYLEAQIGSGNLIGEVIVDQVYAQYQHEDYTLRHPRGGSAGFLTRPLFEHGPRYMEQLARATVDREGSHLKEAMIRVVEDLSDQVEVEAPWEFRNLQRSGHPIVRDDERVIYDRPPKVPRLTELQLSTEERAAGGRS